MFAKAHLQAAIKLVTGYKGEMPFVHYLKQYFSTNKKHGSRDRKQIAQLCYCWFRLGHSLNNVPGEERMIIALFLCSECPNPLLASLHPEWNESAGLPVEEKISLLPPDIFNFPLTIFPWISQLSEGIDPLKFSFSHLQQPDLFLRIRPGYRDAILRKLNKIGQAYTLEGDLCLRLPNGFKVEDQFVLNREVVVQDLSSQRVGDLIDLVSPGLRAMEDARVWDCCAASGGKTLLAFDRMPGLNFTVTDIRNSILQNLFQRFRQAGIYSYDGFVADLSKESLSEIGESFLNLPLQNLIIADVPCSGSGTWSRTPEQLCFFKESAVTDYSELQKKIISNAVRKLAPGGHFLYITCSVFHAENEANVEFLTRQHGLKLMESRIIKGYTQKADTMFAAMLHN
ncbi:Fmu (Sun) domain-containing protein [Flavihumibacter stibioxidans]|uniref:SAM-dependent MTase RsmB/NOP-type domain-containing protein n=1 Tax=Flavihumibacter stibioxidans TaxID=1834163 RepID=A0ABR7M5D0_9BACT|nr:Fmu (Sun) domain-containing protein [Flavihumibacter stibioxidans]MBC6490219.1 hypothetical protein [Flavihumibacter stibioxidans]